MAKRRRGDRERVDRRARRSDQDGEHLRPPFPVGILETEEDVRRYLHARLTSHEWWCIPVVSRNALRVVEVVEERYFPGRTGGFEAVILNERVMGVCAVVLILKRRLPALVLNALLRELGAPAGVADVGGDGDVVAVLDPPAGGQRHRSLARTLAFTEWLEPDNGLSA